MGNSIRKQESLLLIDFRNIIHWKKTFRSSLGSISKIKIKIKGTLPGKGTCSNKFGSSSALYEVLK